MILGGTDGLGSSITQRLASDGSRVYATYNSGSGLEGAAALNHPVKMIRTDVKENGPCISCLIPSSRNPRSVVNAVGGCLLRKPLTEVTMQE